MEASSSSRACWRIEQLIGVSLEPENISDFLYVRGCSATTWKSTCQNCLFDWGPPLAERDGGKQKSYNSQLASGGSIGPVIKTDNVVQLFLTKLNHNDDAKLKLVFSATPDICGFRLQGLERHQKRCTNVWICMMTRLTTHPSFEWYTDKPVRGKPRWTLGEFVDSINMIG